jgi:L-2-hydroxyglutarate oxidase LhgO
MDKFLPEANIAHERLGGLLIAWNQEQFDTLPKLLKQAQDNGETAVKIVSAEEMFSSNQISTRVPWVDCLCRAKGSCVLLQFPWR